MVVFGSVAVVGEGASLLLLTGGQPRPMNVRGPVPRVLPDLFGAGAVLVAALRMTLAPCTPTARSVHARVATEALK